MRADSFGRMESSADIEIIDERGVAVVVDVRSQTGTTLDWAAQSRRSLAARSALPDAKFFLLALPDRFYFWVGKTNREDAVPPDFAASAELPLAPYLEGMGAEIRDLPYGSLDLFVSGWLTELACDPEGARLSEDAIVWAKQSGFRDAVRRGRLKLR